MHATDNTPCVPNHLHMYSADREPPEFSSSIINMWTVYLPKGTSLLVGDQTHLSVLVVVYAFCGEDKPSVQPVASDMAFLPQETNLQDFALLLSQQFTCKGPLSQGHLGERLLRWLLNAANCPPLGVWPHFLLFHCKKITGQLVSQHESTLDALAWICAGVCAWVPVQ